MFFINKNNFKNIRRMHIQICIITGPSASGKDHLVCQIETYINENQPKELTSYHVICTDMFYKDLSFSERILARKGEFNFDDPNSIDSESLIKTVKMFSNIKCTQAVIPVYNFNEHRRTGETIVYLNPLDKRRIIVIQGIFSMCYPKIRDLCNISIFLDTDPDIQVIRRVTRDTVERGRNIENVIKQYEKWVKPGYESYVKPMKDIADLNIQYNSTNYTIVEMIALKLLYGKC